MNYRTNGCSIVGAVLLFTFSFALAHSQERIPRILNGEVTDDFESVGIVGSLRKSGFCTGTLISPRHVLTAGHCAAFIENSQSGTFEIDGRIYVTSDIFIHPDYNDFNLENDIAILELSEPVSGIMPSRIFRDVPRVGEILTIVGFGGQGNAQDGDDGSFGVKVVGETIIEVVTDIDVIWEFDDPSESNTASGDSGGPGLLLVDGVYFVASVTSAGTEPDAGLGDIAYNARVDTYAAWIDSVVESAPDSDVIEEPIIDESPPTESDTPDPDQEVESDEDPSDRHCPDRPFSWLIHLFDHRPFHGNGPRGNHYGDGPRGNQGHGNRFASSDQHRSGPSIGSQQKSQNKRRNRRR